MNTEKYIIRKWSNELREYHYISAPKGFFRAMGGVLRPSDSAKSVEWTNDRAQAMEFGSTLSARRVANQTDAETEIRF